MKQILVKMIFESYVGILKLNFFCKCDIYKLPLETYLRSQRHNKYAACGDFTILPLKNIYR